MNGICFFIWTTGSSVTFLECGKGAYYHRGFQFIVPFSTTMLKKIGDFWPSFIWNWVSFADSYGYVPGSSGISVTVLDWAVHWPRRIWGDYLFRLIIIQLLILSIFVSLIFYRFCRSERLLYWTTLLKHSLWHHSSSCWRYIDHFPLKIHRFSLIRIYYRVTLTTKNCWMLTGFAVCLWVWAIPWVSC